MAKRVYISDSSNESGSDYVDYAHGVDLHDLGLAGERRKWAILAIGIVLVIVVAVGLLAFNHGSGTKPLTQKINARAPKVDEIQSGTRSAMHAWASFSSTGLNKSLNGFVVADSPAYSALTTDSSQTGGAHYEFRAIKITPNATPDSSTSVSREVTARSYVNDKLNVNVHITVTLHLIAGRWQLYEYSNYWTLPS